MARSRYTLSSPDFFTATIILLTQSIDQATGLRTPLHMIESKSILTLSFKATSTCCGAATWGPTLESTLRGAVPGNYPSSSSNTSLYKIHYSMADSWKLSTWTITSSICWRTLRLNRVPLVILKVAYAHAARIKWFKLCSLIHNEYWWCRFDINCICIMRINDLNDVLLSIFILTSLSFIQHLSIDSLIVIASFDHGVAHQLLAWV